MTPILIEDPDDPRVADYRDIRERDLVGRRGLFVAEGEVVLRTLASPASLCRPVSALIACKRVEGLASELAELPEGTPIYAAGQTVLNAIAGFDLHRGILALGERPPVADLDALLAGLGEDALVVVACGIGNHDNMGGLFRNAAAFGAVAMLLDETCCDPLYRKAIRVSVGAALRIPTVRGWAAEALLDHLAAAGFDVLALSPAGETALPDVRVRGRTALVLGSEGPGLSEAVMKRCRTVGIAMSGGFDSLNVAATSAVALHHLTTIGPL